MRLQNYNNYAKKNVQFQHVFFLSLNADGHELYIYKKQFLRKKSIKLKDAMKMTFKLN